ncbi:hypothetical protein BTR23_16115 [Alkalihalophilus pseudofirmus]|nr:hypothetical protein BTR23_16115 [Alkalihalophilus pseudofirmus]
MNPNKKRLIPGSYHTSGHVHMSHSKGNKSNSPYNIYSSTNKQIRPNSGGCGCGNKAQRT